MAKNKEEKQTYPYVEYDAEIGVAYIHYKEGERSHGMTSIDKIIELCGSRYYNDPTKMKVILAYCSMYGIEYEDESLFREYKFVQESEFYKGVFPERMQIAWKVINKYRQSKNQTFVSPCYFAGYIGHHAYMVILLKKAFFTSKTGGQKKISDLWKKGLLSKENKEKMQKALFRRYAKPKIKKTNDDKT